MNKTRCGSMKPIKINFFKLTYTIDLPVLLLFIAVSLDIISTTLFVVLGAGFEVNLILGKLIDISIWFIPIYLFATDALFIPFLSGILRKSFSYALAFLSIAFAINNFSLILFDFALVIDTIGYNASVIITVLIGLSIFAYLIIKERLNKREILFTCLKLVLFSIFIGLVHLGFFGISQLAV